MVFNKDVIIDLISYRKHGHNEADEPSATQPCMYKKVKEHKSPGTLYGQQLIKEGVVSAQDIDSLIQNYRKKLDKGEVVIDELEKNSNYSSYFDWEKYKKFTVDHEPVNTKVDKKQLIKLAQSLYDIPGSFVLQKQVGKMISQKQAMARGELSLDWGFAENLAYATLLAQGYNIRLSGQDSERGTFAHRHSVLHDQNSGEKLIKLKEVNSKVRFEVINSFLSEMAVLAFEYGYATTDPETLTIWEAQFGDFANGAQVVIDQFISSGEAKWGRLSGLVMLLPHGFEGMGPEHSSARLERYMQLCAQQNIQVCVPSTSAQVFHMLRRQIIDDYRRPLIVMTPKSLLRHKLAASTLDDLSNGSFNKVIPEIDKNLSSSLRRIILCSGKVYYDLLEYRKKEKITDVALIRLEQLYPFPEKDLIKIMNVYNNVSDIIWCQEEPENQGAWYCIVHNLNNSLSSKQKISYCGRQASSSPAVGSARLHKQEQQQVVEEAFK